MPRVKLFDQEKALNQAMMLFWEKGYEATSLSDLTRTLNIGKGSFYDTFGSKRELFDQCLLAYRTTSLDVLDQLLSQQSEPVEVIRNLLQSHTSMMLSDPAHKGCFIANSTTELADDPSIQAFLKEHNTYMRSKLMKVFEGSRFESEAGVLSDLILTHITGISVMTKFVKEPERFQVSNEAFMRVFEP